MCTCTTLYTERQNKKKQCYDRLESELIFVDCQFFKDLLEGYK